MTPVGGARTIAALLALAASGCYRRHGRSEPDGSVVVRDAGLARDAAARRDAALPDAGETPLPRDFEDPGPDARPSDDPASMGWRDEPDLDPEDPCCDPIGPPVDIPVGGDAVGDVSIAFADDGWGVLYADIERGAAFQALAVDGSLVGALRRYSEVSAQGAWLVWGEDRFGALVVREGSGDQDTVLSLLDRRGVLAAGWTDLVPHLPRMFPWPPRLARVAYRDRWLLVSNSGEPNGYVWVLEVDGDAHVLSRTRIADDAIERAQIVGMKGRAVAFWRTAGDTIAQTLTLPTTELSSAPVRLGATQPDGFAAARLRDRAAIVGVDRAAGADRWSLGLFDPFAEEGHMVPVSVADPSVTIVRLVGLDDPGVLATCGHRSGFGPAVHLFTPDGEVLGPTLDVAEDETTSCALGALGDTLYVAWPRARQGTVRVQGFALRRRRP